jgi:hypothetical protein
MEVVDKAEMRTRIFNENKKALRKSPLTVESTSVRRNDF